MLEFIPLIILSIGAPPRAQPPRCEIEVTDTTAPRITGGASRWLVAEATVIVRARAAERDTAVRGTAVRGTAHDVRFDVLEVLKAPASRRIPPTLEVPGGYVSRDDYNPGPVPYTQVRPSGLRGSCYASEFKAGAEYLLLLAESADGQLSPYWSALMPTDEQIRGADDAWLAWVRGQLHPK